MKIEFITESKKNQEAWVLFVEEKGQLGAQAKKVDTKSGGFISNAIKLDKFSGKKNEILILTAPPKLDCTHVILMGRGEEKDITESMFENIGGTLVGKLNARSVKTASVFWEKAKGVSEDDGGSALAYGAVLGGYKFDKYLTKQPADKKPSLKSLSIILKDTAATKKKFSIHQKIADGVFLTRDLVSEPANILYPESFTKRAKDELSKLGVKLDVLTPRQMKKLGMGALLSVGQGSDRESRLVVMRYNGAPKSASAKDKKPIAFVGKGVTFDTGGISLKPGPGMSDMKFDMGGAGVVTGLMKALAGRKAKVNVIGVMALAENMPSGGATRPGDVVTSMSGQTIEVLNTDAEGRMVLCDALWYVQEKYKPRMIVDLATLTGAIIVALGHEYAGIFSNDDELPKQLITAGDVVGEKAWHMPMCEAWDKVMDSPIADIKNISGGSDAGSATAAAFLERFIKKGTSWAHIDIAGVAWTKKDTPIIPKGATGYGVRLLNQFVADNYEK